jgi:F-type H+-transporting ATPase subunit gamma
MNIRQVRKKIKSISNVKKITKAMQLVSAVKMKKAQQLALEGNPYRDTLETIIKKLLPSIDTTLSPLLSPPAKTIDKELIILITANKGLCGSFNMNIFRMMLKQIDFKKTEVITVGKKGAWFSSSMGSKIIADFSGANPLIDVSAIFDLALKKFLDGEYSQVSIVYNKFISTLKFESKKEPLLPLRMNVKEGKEQDTEYTVEPSPQAIVDQMLQSYVEEKVRGAILNSEAAEHSARMIAMKNATDNANDVIYNLTMIRNKLRQEKITYELLDMVTAKESVEQG